MADLNLKDFISHFSAVAACVPSRTPKDILKNVKMVSSKNKIELMASNGEVTMHREIPVEDGQEVTVLLPAGRLLQVLRELDGPKFSFDFAEIGSGTVFIQSGFSEFKLQVVDSADFPQVPTFTDEAYLKLDGVAFKSMIKKTIFCVDPESTRYALGGLQLEYASNQLTVAATDSRRLCVIHALCGFVGDFPKIPVVVPAAAMKLVESAIEDKSGEVWIAMRQNDASFKIGQTTISAQLVQGRFPGWQKVVPEESAYKSRVTIPAPPFATLCRQANIATDEESRGIHLRFTKGELIVTSKANDIGSAKVKMPLAYEGEEMTITVDGRYLLEYLKVMGTESADWGLLAHDDRITAKMGEWTHVIMPLARD